MRYLILILFFFSCNEKIHKDKNDLIGEWDLLANSNKFSVKFNDSTIQYIYWSTPNATDSIPFKYQIIKKDSLFLTFKNDGKIMDSIHFNIQNDTLYTYNYIKVKKDSVI